MPKIIGPVAALLAAASLVGAGLTVAGIPDDGGIGWDRVQNAPAAQAGARPDRAPSASFGIAESI
ncbi:hypothetical protein [Streptomyces sp. SGAir0957]